MPIHERFIHTAHAMYQRIRRFIRPEYPAAVFRGTQGVRCRYRRIAVALMLVVLIALLVLFGPTIIRELSSRDMQGFVIFLIGFSLFFPLYHGFLFTVSYLVGEWLFGETWFIADDSLVRASRVARKELRLGEVSSIEYEDHPRRGVVFRLQVAMRESGAPADSWDIIDVDNRAGLFSAIRPHLSPSVPIKETAWYSTEWTYAVKRAVLLFGVGGAVFAAIVYFSYPYL